MDELEAKILKIGNEAVRKAQRKSLEKGVANVYSKDGQIFFQLPDLTITTEIPEGYRKNKELLCDK